MYSMHYIHRFTIEDFHRMAEAGILSETDRVELLHGEIVEMTPIHSRHAAGVDRLARLFFETAGKRAHIRIQNPIRIPDHSEPQPDLVLARLRDDDYAGSHPGPGDVLLLVEVSDTTAGYDREVKIPLYAAAGIPEVWLVDLPGRAVEVYQDPAGDVFKTRHRRGPGQHLDCSGLAGVQISVTDDLAP